MPVDTTHELFDASVGKWTRARDVIDGGDMVKHRGITYLPKLKNQTDTEYSEFKDRATFFNATSRTLDGLVGSIFRKNPKVELPEGEQFEAIKKDFDLMGKSVEDYAVGTVTEVLTVARGGTLVDFNEEERRPYGVFYKAEDILNWRMQRINGSMKLVLLVLKETVLDAEMPSDNREAVTASAEESEYQPDRIEKYRVLKLVGDPESGAGFQYVVEVWRAPDKRQQEQDFILEEIIEPTRRNQPLDFIPFYFHGPKESDAEPEKLPLDDMILVNLDHYRLSADYKHGLHFAAMPTAWVAGFPKDSVLTIGSSVAWVSENTDAKAGFLEFTGQGLDPIKDALEKDEKYMSILGARLLEEQKREAETAETMKIRQSGESSVLAMLSINVSQSLSLALKTAAWWMGTGEEKPEDTDDETVSIELNRDFLTAKLAPSEVVQLVSAWQQRGISQETLLWNLKQGEILPPNRTEEEEADLIETDLDALMPGMGSRIDPEDLDDDSEGKGNNKNSDE